jgi:hypothetical protein
MPAAPADPFDLWLSRDLHSFYSGVAAEPIPPELLRMLDGPAEAVEARAIGPPPSREQGTGGLAGGKGSNSGFESAPTSCG